MTRLRKWLRLLSEIWDVIRAWWDLQKPIERSLPESALIQVDKDLAKWAKHHQAEYRGDDVGFKNARILVKKQLLRKARRKLKE